MKRACAILLLFTITAPASQPPDWSQWRGPHRDGTAPALKWPAPPEKLTEQWFINIGEGHASPIVADGKIFVFSRSGEAEALRAINPADGKFIWEHTYPVSFKMNRAAVEHGMGPKSTPLYHDGRIYTLGISGVLSCVDAKSGNPIWSYDSGKFFKQGWPLIGVAMSPGIFDGLLIANLGTNDDGALIAFHSRNGDVKWSWKGDGPGYASPVVVQAGGVKQIITQTQKYVVGVELATGKLLWSLSYPTEWGENILTPVMAAGLLIIRAVDGGFAAYRLPAAAGEAPQLAWQTKEVTPYMSSPVASGNFVFGFSARNKGQYFCLDVQSGKVLWRSDPRQGENASVLLAGDYLVLLNTGGELVIASADGAAFKPLRTYETAWTETWAHPALLDDGVLIKAYDSLAYWAFR